MHDPIRLQGLAENPELNRQYGLLVRLRQVLAADARCLGAAAVGSLAEGRADRMSDVDLLVFCEAGAARTLLKSLSEAAADAHVVHRLVGEHDSHSVYEKVILEDWSSYELHVIEPSTHMRLKPPYVEVIHLDGCLEARLSDDKPIGRELAKPHVNGDAGLFWELFNCIKWLRRGEVEFTARYLQALGKRLKQRTPLLRGAVPKRPSATIRGMMDWSRCPAVERDAHRVSGAWVFRGTRVPVSALFENLEDNASLHEFVAWFPGVTVEQARSVLEHAARSALEAA